jgi:hypothetical protein
MVGGITSLERGCFSTQVSTFHSTQLIIFGSTQERIFCFTQISPFHSTQGSFWCFTQGKHLLFHTQKALVALVTQVGICCLSCIMLVPVYVILSRHYQFHIFVANS